MKISHKVKLLSERTFKGVKNLLFQVSSERGGKGRERKELFTFLQDMLYSIIHLNNNSCVEEYYEMEYQKYGEKELAFGTLLRRTLFRWRVILLVAVLGTATGFSCEMIKSSHQAAQTISAQKKYQEEKEKYEKKSAYYKDQENNLKKQITEKQNYLHSSILSHIDPKKEGYAVVNLVVRSQGGSDTDILQAVQSYASFFKSGVNWERLAGEMGKSAEYLQELVTVVPDSENKQNYSTSQTVYVRTIGRTNAEAEKILKYMLDQMPEAETKIAKAIPHTVTEMFQSSGYRVDNDLNSRLHSELDLLKNMNNDLETMKSDGAAVVKPEKPEEISKEDLLKTTGKYMAVGFIGGGVLMYILVSIYLVFCNRVLSADELNRSYQLKNLVTVQTAKKKGIDRKLRRGIPVDTESEDEAWRIAALNFAADDEVQDKVRKVLICGDLPKERLCTIADKIESALNEVEGITDCRCLPVERIYGKPEALEQLKIADGVILVEQVEYSNYNEITRDVIAVKSCEKKIFGSITLET